MKNKKTIVAVAAILLIAVVGATLAYFQSSASFENVFNTGTYKVVTTEVFESPTNWKPGEEIPKTITSTNEGTIPAAVRVSYTEQWLDEKNNDITSQVANGTVIINLDNTSDWTNEGNYYYYNYILEPQQSTTSFIKSVTLNPNLNGITCTPSNDGSTQTCTSNNPILGGTYKLTITKETVQADRYQDIWNTNVEITEKTLAIGDTVNYSTLLNGITLNNWKVFYVEDDYTYLIYGDYLPSAAVNIENLKLYGNYSIQTEEGEQVLLDAITNKSNWDALLTGTINGHAVNEERTNDVWAIGSPTLELWVNSWNESYPNDKLGIKRRYENIGNFIYFYKDGENVENNFINKIGYGNKLYFPYQSYCDDAIAYWIADWADDEYLLSIIVGNSSVISLSDHDGAWYMSALRPVIKLPTSILNQ